MGEVVELDKQRPHIVAQVICVGCSYSAVGVSPQDGKRYDLECPRCKEMKMVIIGLGDEQEA